MRGLKSTLALLVVLAGLGGFIYYDSKKPDDSGTGQEKLFPQAKEDTIDEITVRNESGEVTTLKKTDGTWKLTAPVAVNASASDATNLAGALAGMEITRVLDENPSSLGEYGLDKPRIQIDFKAPGQPEGHLYIGEKTPTGAALYVRRNDDKKVLLIGAFNEPTLNRTTFDLRDKTFIAIPRAKVQSIEIVNDGKPVVLTKKEKEWRVTTPVDARADYSSSEAIIGRVEAAQMTGIASDNAAAADLKQYGLDKPVVRLTLHFDGSPDAVIEFGSEAGTDAVYARDTSRPMVMTVEKAFLDDFKKSVDDFRRRDVFDFRAFNASRAELSWGGKSMTIERVKTEGEKPDTWKRVAPSDKELDKEKVETLLTGLADIRATGFRDAKAGTGLDSPALTVYMKFDQSRSEERATFGQAGADAFAARPDDAGAMVIEADKLKEALALLDELVK